MKFDFTALLSKISEALLSAPKKDYSHTENSQKSAYKPIIKQNGSNLYDKNGSNNSLYNGNTAGYISPKESMIELLRKHDELSKKIDDAEKHKTEEKK